MRRLAAAPHRQRVAQGRRASQRRLSSTDTVVGRAGGRCAPAMAQRQQGGVGYANGPRSDGPRDRGPPRMGGMTLLGGPKVRPRSLRANRRRGRSERERYRWMGFTCPWTAAPHHLHRPARGGGSMWFGSATGRADPQQQRDCFPDGAMANPVHVRGVRPCVAACGRPRRWRRVHEDRVRSGCRARVWQGRLVWGGMTGAVEGRRLGMVTASAGGRPPGHGRRRGPLFSSRGVGGGGCRRGR